jgi:16S rRNA processing protein RimM
MPSAELIAIGIIRRPVGLEGFCAIEAFGATFPALEPPCSVLIGRDAANAQSMALSEISSRGGGYQIRFEGRNDRESVEGLRGLTIFAENGALPRLPGNEFYHFELKGMDVFSDTTGASIGTVIEVHNLPSMDTLEVALKNGTSILLPLSQQAVTVIDKANNRMTVRHSFIEELLE